MRILFVIAFVLLVAPSVQGVAEYQSRARVRAHAKLTTRTHAPLKAQTGSTTLALFKAHAQALTDNRMALKTGEGESAEVVAWQTALAKTTALNQAKVQAHAQSQAQSSTKGKTKANADAHANVNANANAHTALDNQVQSESLLQIGAQVQAKAKAKANVQAGGQAKAKTEVDVEAQAQAQAQAYTAVTDDTLPTDVDYYIQVMVAPDDPDAGTSNPISIQLEGSDAQMGQGVEFAPGLTLGETLALVVTATDVGQPTDVMLSMEEGGDPALVELLSLDMFPMNDENGDSKYINFANAPANDDEPTWIDDATTLSMTPKEGYVITVRTSNFIHGGTMNPISIKFNGETGDSSVMELHTGFAQADSSVIVLEDPQGAMVANILACVLSVDYLDDDVWLPDTVWVHTPTQRAVFRNADSTFIGFKPQKFWSDTVKMQIAREAKGSSSGKSKSQLVLELLKELGEDPSDTCCSR